MATPETANAYSTDIALLNAIETITGGSFEHDVDACGCYYGEPNSCADPAVALWGDGGRDDDMAAELDHTTPGWRDDGLWWGEELFRG